MPVPSIELQNNIAEVQKLSTREQRLLNRIRELRRVLVDGLMQDAVRRECSGRAAGNQ